MLFLLEFVIFWWSAVPIAITFAFSAILTNSFRQKFGFFKEIKAFNNLKRNKFYFDWSSWCSTLIFSIFQILKKKSVGHPLLASFAILWEILTNFDQF
jgi:hypothetical protein